MADNVAITPGSGKNIAADDVGGVLFQRVKFALGIDGVFDSDVSATNPLPISIASNIPLGNVAHDAADSGAPVKTGARASGTLSNDTMVADGDRTDNLSDLDGAVLTRTQFPLGDLISERITDTTGTSTAFTNFGATTSTRNYVTSITVYNNSATAGYVDIRDGAAGAILYTIPLPAGGGATINSPFPLFRSTANTALAYDVSAALTTVFISMSGFKSKV